MFLRSCSNAELLQRQMPLTRPLLDASSSGYSCRSVHFGCVACSVVAYKSRSRK